MRDDSPRLVAQHTPNTRWFSSADEWDAARVMVIAEIGVNHDGRAELAIDLTRQAARAGADAVKLQLFDPRKLLSAQAGLAQYQAEEGETDAFEMLDRLKLTTEQMRGVKAEAHALGMAFIVTPFSVENVEALRELGADLVKIASPDAVNTPLLDACATLGVPMIVSTGTCGLDELDHAAACVRRAGGCLLQCVSRYPTPDEDAAIAGMVAMRDEFGVAVGYSDHTADRWTGALAVAAGACVIEKHFTYDRDAQGPDHAASLEQAAFCEYVEHIRRASVMMGPICKKQAVGDTEVRELCRQSVCATRDLPAGHRLTRDDLTVRRPGTGIPATQLPSLLGRRLQRAIEADHLLEHHDISEPIAQAS